MIEVPHDFLNALFALLIVFASLNRSRRRPGWNGTLALQSLGFQAGARSA
jgi:hypothetical protein